MRHLLTIAVWLLAVQFPLSGKTISTLLSRGYTLLPYPQKVTLGAQDLEFTQAWTVAFAAGRGGDEPYAELNDLLEKRFHLSLHKSTSGTAGNLVRLAITPNTVAVTNVTDSDRAALAEQAYRLSIKPNEITITGNTETGLYYGIQTLVQLLKEQAGKIWLPAATIEDWPDMKLRVIYWDDAHHLERLADLKAAIRQASFYKINGFAIKLEGHFQYSHAAPIVDPYALSPSELQEVTDYGLKHHVQVIPYLDGPAHDAFILKHPEYASLREFPDSNYEVCATNPETIRLFDGMFDDLLAANKGGKYFVLSTDEPYYVGLADNAQCQEAKQTKQLGSPGKVLAGFVTKTAGYLHNRGRTVIFWGEYPLKPDDIGSLPSYLINGEAYGPRFDPVFRAHGIRQMIYTSTEGEEQLFPNYYVLPSSSLLHTTEEGSRKGRVQEMLDSISFAPISDPLGVFVAGWADAGLHPETFWLGYATGPAAGWNRHAMNPEELQGCFYSLFYGAGSTNMGRLYQLMSEGARFWEDSWEIGLSTARKPIWGNSSGPFHPPRPARDQYLPPLPVPSPGVLHVPTDWLAENDRRLTFASKSLARNDELLDLLYANVQTVRFNRYNLAVYLSIAKLYRQNLAMIRDLGQIAQLLKQAGQAAGRAKAADALASLDQALDAAKIIRDSRNQVLRDTTATWYESWFPRVAQANGRTYLNEVDDVKDHQPVRTIDMSYLVYRELLYPLGEWANQVIAIRNQYAAAHGLPYRDFKLDWKNTSGKGSEN